MRRQHQEQPTDPPNLLAASDLSNERKECMFCLEEEFGRKKYPTIWYSQLYPCECRFASHWQCLTRWQVACDDELQCPICKVFSNDPLDQELVPEQPGELMPDSSRIYPPVEMPIKIRFCIVTYFFFLVWMFFYGYSKLFTH
jgi:hypothetical protein